jgi:hypothetical protein
MAQDVFNEYHDAREARHEVISHEPAAGIAAIKRTAAHLRYASEPIVSFRLTAGL